MIHAVLSFIIFFIIIGGLAYSYLTLNTVLFVFTCGVGAVTGGFYILKRSVNMRRLFKDYCDRRDENMKLRTSLGKILKVFYRYFDSTFVAIQYLFKEGQLPIGDYDNPARQYLKDLYEKNNIDRFFADNLPPDNENPEENDCGIDAVEYVRRADMLLGMVKDIEPQLYNDLLNKVDWFIKKETFQRLVVQNSYCIDIVDQMINSVVRQITTTSQPLSGQILLIKENISMFLKTITKWNTDLSDETSEKNFNFVIRTYNNQKDEFGKIFETLKLNFNHLETSLKGMLDLIERIFENSGKINDVSEKIKILSINASIESERAGASGKGFKIIAGEISKLSEYTGKFVADIIGLIQKTRESAGSTIINFNNEGSEIVHKLSDHKDEFQKLYEKLNGYHEDFNSIFALVTKTTADINSHIDDFSPVFQLHDVSIQQLQNLNRIVRKVLEKHKDNPDLNNVIDMTDKKKRDELLNDIIAIAEKELTTEQEIEVINHISEKYQSDRRIGIAPKRGGEVDYF